MAADATKKDDWYLVEYDPQLIYEEWGEGVGKYYTKTRHDTLTMSRKLAGLTSFVPDIGKIYRAAEVCVAPGIKKTIVCLTSADGKTSYRWVCSRDTVVMTDFALGEALETVVLETRGQAERCSAAEFAVTTS